MHRRSILKAMAALPVAGFAAPAFGQTYPDRPIKLIVPYLAGGATDVGARVVAERMAKGLGQPIVIDNRPGAGVIVGTNAVAKADPDGYTLLMTTLAHSIKNMIGVTAAVRIADSGGIERSLGKAKRIVDKRPKT